MTLARLAALISCLIVGTLASGCSRQFSQAALTEQARSRSASIPTTAVKMTPENDPVPPQLHSTEYLPPVPLGGAINTAGAEDSPFITQDSSTLYFFFTPDPSVPPEKQVLDGVTGLYVSKNVGGMWTDAQRVVLQDKGKPALDGGACVQGNTMWFVSARQGNYRGVDVWTARLEDGRWTDWKNAGRKLNVDLELGELHVTPDGNEMYFHSARTGGQGGLDIWVTRKVGGDWQVPENVSAVNTPGDDGWPFLTQDGQELWFTRLTPGPEVWRSLKKDGKWQAPELIVSNLAGEPTIDSAGNLYFVHHRFDASLNQVTEADIYVCYRKQPDQTR